MKRYLFIFIFLIITTFCANSQIRISIDTLFLKQISVIIPQDFSESIFDSFLDTGPEAIFYISITNQSDSFLPIHYNDWTFGYFYSYKGKTYNSNFFSFGEPFTYRLLIPGETLSYYYKESILLCYDIRKDKKNFNYTKEMLEIVPSIRVYAISPDNNIFISDKYKNIIIEKKESKEKGYEDILNIPNFLEKLSLE